MLDFNQISHTDSIYHFGGTFRTRVYNSRQWLRLSKVFIIFGCHTKSIYDCAIFGLLLACIWQEKGTQENRISKHTQPKRDEIPSDMLLACVTSKYTKYVTHSMCTDGGEKQNNSNSNSKSREHPINFANRYLMKKKRRERARERESEREREKQTEIE